MRSFAVSILILFVLAQFNFGQSKTKNKTVPNYPTLLVQAKEMIKAVSADDFAGFTDFMYPKVIDFFGGRDKMIQVLKDTSEKTTAAGVTVLDYQMNKPIQILRVKKQIFAVLPTKVKMRTPDTGVITEDSLIGISNDNGKNWKFIRVESKEAVRPFIPDVIDKLRIPKSKISFF